MPSFSNTVSRHCLWPAILLRLCCGSDAAESTAQTATILVHARQQPGQTVPPNLTGKFCEHLGNNIYNGMDAQVLKNPTFADYPFWSGQMTPDGLTSFLYEHDKIEAELRRQAFRSGWPEQELSRLVSARNEGLACFWGRVGPTEDISVSPDTSPQGGRAQRLELKAGGGIKQWTWLPLHRVRTYDVELYARSPDLKSITVALFNATDPAPCAQTTLGPLSTEWRKLSGSLRVPQNLPSDQAYCFQLTAASAGTLIIGHAFLRPTDHRDGADPDVIRLLKESHLPLLRWPGGNFVSAYHWADGIGAVESRPTRPNYAWGGVEPNTFGTDEFVAFCRAVGCEPMICINAGTGSPEEAAEWIDYCNGPASSPMGKKRAANGHPKPYNIRHWEVGNELWGHWQAHWTTATGYADRYLQFSRAMLRRDPKIKLYACGAPVLWGRQWNKTLIGQDATRLQSITDHPLIGGTLPPATDPLDVFRDFMLVPEILAMKWEELRADMSQGGVREPRLAVTELQMFAHLGGESGGKPQTLTRDNLVNPSTLGEALYDTLIYHQAIRLQPFVELVTHSATVNHGGGLRKEHERVYANPCHYANAMFSEFNGARVIQTETECPSEQAPIVLPEIKNAAEKKMFSSISAVAAMNTKGTLLVSLVNRGTAGAVVTSLKLDGVEARGRATVTTLCAAEPWAANTLAAPEKVSPAWSQAELRNGEINLVLPAFSVVQLSIACEQPAGAK